MCIFFKHTPSDKEKTENIFDRNLAMGILIAEDDPDMANLYASTLKSLGHKVYVTHNGEECLSVYRYALSKTANKSFPIDVIIVDYAMPKKDGVSLTKDILKHRPDQRIIFVSAHGNLLLSELEKIDGRIEFLTKPVSLISLVAKVEGKRIKDVTRALQQSQ